MLRGKRPEVPSQMSYWAVRTYLQEWYHSMSSFLGHYQYRVLRSTLQLDNEVVAISSSCGTTRTA